MCVFKQGTTNSECQCISHSASDDVQPRGENLWAGRWEWNYCCVLVKFSSTCILTERLHAVWSIMQYKPLYPSWFRVKKSLKSSLTIAEHGKSCKCYVTHILVQFQLSKLHENVKWLHVCQFPVQTSLNRALNILRSSEKSTFSLSEALSTSSVWNILSLVWEAAVLLCAS